MNTLLPSDISGSSPPTKRQRGVPAVQQVLPGELISTEPGYLRGHGTFEQNGVLVSTISGVVERVNKLISVVPLRSRYSGDVGDVVIGRISEVGNNRWKVDVNAKQDAVLLLSSINLPGGILRRRTKEDALLMRNFFVENDLISAEVQQFYHDGSMSLHTRNLKYGKLQNGQFLSVPAALIKRGKSHFLSLPCNVDVIVGNNGYIFISTSPKKGKELDGGMNDSEDTKVSLTSEEKEIRKQERLNICRVRNSIQALADNFIAIYEQTIIETFEASLHYEPKEMLRPEIMKEIISISSQRTDHYQRADE
mmetsp:Transcript_14139/g.24066  ORF Transcript_14139/g.24066 Transcript_14139/m.24066 type:complete len:308 (+) Transcript_14139:2-925(+)